MARQNHLPHHPGILLSRQQRTGINKVHGYEVLHPTIFLSPTFPGGLSLDSCIVDPSEAEHMSQMHYFCLLDESCLCLEPSNNLPLFTELPRRTLLGYPSLSARNLDPEMSPLAPRCWR